jgi:hypothetical protein
MQVDGDFEASLGYRVRSCLKKSGVLLDNI